MRFSQSWKALSKQNHIFRDPLDISHLSRYCLFFRCFQRFHRFQPYQMLSQRMNHFTSLFQSFHYGPLHCIINFDRKHFPTWTNTKSIAFLYHFHNLVGTKNQAALVFFLMKISMLTLYTWLNTSNSPGPDETLCYGKKSLTVVISRTH